MLFSINCVYLSMNWTTTVKPISGSQKSLPSLNSGQQTRQTKPTTGSQSLFSRFVEHIDLVFLHRGRGDERESISSFSAHSRNSSISFAVGSIKPVDLSQITSLPTVPFASKSIVRPSRMIFCLNWKRSISSSAKISTTLPRPTPDHFETNFGCLFQFVGSSFRCSSPHFASSFSCSIPNRRTWKISPPTPLNYFHIDEN